MSLSRTLSLPLLLATASLLIACSGPSEDVRLTLCQGLVEELYAVEGLEWTGHEAVMRGYEDLEMRVRFARPGGGGGEAACFYPYEAVDADARQLAEPTSVYSTNPRRMVLDGAEVVAQTLAPAVNRVLLKQGREALERGREAAGRGIEEAKRLSGGAE